MKGEQVSCVFGDRAGFLAFAVAVSPVHLLNYSPAL
jgi:hypothetical protein